MKNMTRALIIAAAVTGLLGTAVIAGEQERRGQARKREETQDTRQTKSQIRTAPDDTRQERSRREQEERDKQERNRRETQEKEKQDRSRRDTEEREKQERSRRESEERSRRDAEERASQERSRREAEERGRREAEERSNQERSRREAEERSRRDAEARASQERSRREAEERSRRDAEERASQERSRRESEERSRRDAEERSRVENERRNAVERSRQEEESRRRDLQERNRQEEARRAGERSRDTGSSSTPYIRPQIQNGPDRESNPSVGQISRGRSNGGQDGSVRTARPRVEKPQTQDPRNSSRSRDTGLSGGVNSGNNRNVVIRGRDESSAPLYQNSRTARKREGSFTPSTNERARNDREFAGKIHMRYNNQGSRNLVKEKGGNIRFYYANPEYSSSGWKLVDRDRFGNHRINRHWLIHHDGRWGYCSDLYNRRNYHFYITLVSNNYYYGLGYSTWERRYYGDGWDSDFGWDSGYYIPASYRQHGAWYFEPNYAFSFTFNHGYEQGYIDGYDQGVQDWNRYASYYSYHSGVRGWYDEIGPYYEYADGYEQGFRQGYYAGYCGLEFGWDNFGFGDFSHYPVIYDFDYDYLDRDAAWDSGYEYDDRW